jgi:hypothetical protein
MAVQSVKQLEIYQVAYSLAMRVFDVSKRFPSEGAKRRYEANYISKLTDCDGLRLSRAYGSESKTNETDSSLDFARDCNYISKERRTKNSGSAANQEPRTKN